MHAAHKLRACRPHRACRGSLSVHRVYRAALKCPQAAPGRSAVRCMRLQLALLAPLLLAAGVVNQQVLLLTSGRDAVRTHKMVT